MPDNQPSAYDWGTFVKRVDIKNSPQKLYESWATQQGLENWFLRSAIFISPGGKTRGRDELIQAGDQYEWLWHGYDDSTVEKGTIIEANGKDKFKFSFGKAGTVTVLIKMEQNENIVELIQEDIPQDEQSKVYWHIGCSTGWVFYMANLKSKLEGGIDLRNKNIALKNMINA